VHTLLCTSMLSMITVQNPWQGLWNGGSYICSVGSRRLVYTRGRMPADRKAIILCNECNDAMENGDRSTGGHSGPTT
jgi:hypothetical protein